MNTILADTAARQASRPAGSPYRVLHVLDHSWPVLDGYSQRSRSIITAQAQLGMQPQVLTSPLHQRDDPAATDLSLDSIKYLRTPEGAGLRGAAIRGRWPILREASVVHLLRRKIDAVLASGEFDIVHAHSPALCGLAALRAARARSVPVVYEVRSFWEDSAVHQEGQVRLSPKYWLGRELETHVVRQADAIVGIAASILRDLEGRGISAEKLFHVPNGVDVARFSPQPRDQVLARELGVESMPTLGYLGTFFPWEGVPWMVRAAAELKRQGVAFKLLIAGDGADKAQIEEAIRSAGAADYVMYLGRIPHDQVPRYYSVMDVLTYPRLRTRLTELVTPLKPLEAMALGKAVLASGVGGLRELIEPESTGVLFAPEDTRDFGRHAARLLADANLRRTLGEQAREDVIAQRDWKSVVARYSAVYASALQGARGLSGSRRVRVAG